MLEFEPAEQQEPAADDIAVVVGRPERLVLVSANGLRAAGIESQRRRQQIEILRLGGAGAAAGDQPVAMVERSDELDTAGDLGEADVGGQVCA